MAERKIYTYMYNVHEKCWEKFSLEILCDIADRHRKERVALVKDCIANKGEWQTVPKSKAKYKVIRLLPSKLLMVAGSGMSVALLNTG